MKLAENLSLRGNETICPECEGAVSVVALPGDGGMRIGWHRVVDASVVSIARPVYRSCSGSWSKVAP